MRPAIILAGLLAGCTTTTSIPESNPDYAAASGAGVGFGDYQSYEQAQRRAARPAPPVVPQGPVVSAEAVVPPAAPEPPRVRGEGALDPAIVAAVEGTAGQQGRAFVPPAAPASATVGLSAPRAVVTPAGSPLVVIPPAEQRAFPEAPAPAAVPAAKASQIAQPLAPSAPGISDEQDFAAVSERETIESDAARLERLRLERTVVEPQALPDRVSTGPNIVEYALRTTNAVGQPTWRRTTVFAQGRYDRNCGGYATADRAQEAFLAMGGPARDKKGLDPDGDGFACDWSPAPFRAAVGR